jgi:tetratricopeptide (TPR) repeat protein
MVATALLLAICTSVSAKEKWLTVRTQNFTVVSNASEDDARRVGLKLEQFRAIFVKLLKIPATSPVPITVVVFKNSDSFKPFKPLYNRKPANVAGYFQRGDDENLIALELGASDERPLGVIFHEYTHFLTAYSPRPWPVWLQEGVAELYSTFEVKKNEVTIGSPVSSHVYRLRENKFIPLDRLIQVGHDSPDYNEGSRQGIFYAESWAFAHYLMFGNKGARQPQLLQFTRLYNAGATVERAFSEAFKTDFATMEKELKRYIGNDSYPGVIYTMENVEGPADTTSRTLSDGEVQFYLGDLLLHTNRIDEAEAFFKKALSLDPDLAGAYEGLGFVAMRREKYSEARDLFKKAVSLGSRNYLAHYFYAEALHRELRSDQGSFLASPEVAATIASELKTAIKLMPGFAPAYNLLAFMSLAGNEPLAQGVDAINTAMRLQPQNKVLALTLAQLQIRAQDLEAARQTLKPLTEGETEPALRASAESLLRHLESYQQRATVREDADGASGSPLEDEKAERETPHLKRREPVSPGGSNGEANPPSPAPAANGRSVRGILTNIDCLNGMVLVLKTSNGILRFMVSDPMKLTFYSREPGLNVSTGCGPLNIAALINFKEVPAGKGGFAGDATSVEFVKDR